MGGISATTRTVRNSDCKTEFLVNILVISRNVIKVGLEYQDCVKVFFTEVSGLNIKRTAGSYIEI